MKNGFLKGLLLGLAICVVSVSGVVVAGLGILNRERQQHEEIVPATTSVVNNDNIVTPVPQKGEVNTDPTLTPTPTPQVTQDADTTPTPTPTPVPNPLQPNDGFDSEAAYKVAEIIEYIQHQYLFEVSKDDIMTAMCNGLMSALNDPYSFYYTPQATEQDKEENQVGKYSGIGVTMSISNGYVTVTEITAESPAESAGMCIGDIITEVDGINIIGAEAQNVAKYVRGEAGTYVKITVYRPSLEEYITLDIMRDVISLKSVKKDMLEGNIGYVRVTKFAAYTWDEYKEAVDYCLENNAAGLIIDMRGNGGGYIDAAQKMADYILPQGNMIFGFKSKSERVTKYFSTDGHQVDLPVVILVDQNTASSSELFTLALRDNEHATVMGVKSFGKGIAQNVIPFENDGTMIQLTAFYLVGPNEECIHKIGIIPEVDLSELDADAQVEYARKYLLGQ